MALIDDLKAHPPKEDITRRRTLGRLTGAAFAIAGGGTAITMIKFLRPAVLFEPPTLVGVGRPEDIAVGTLLVLVNEKLYVARTEAGVFAMSSVCTHLGCMTRLEPSGAEIFCPCHGSRFDVEGQVTAGPAPRPLVRRRVFIKEGLLTVDTRSAVGPDEVLAV